MKRTVVKQVGGDLFDIVAPFLEAADAARASGTSTPIVGTSEDLSVISQGDLPLLGGNEEKRVIVPPKTHIRLLHSLMSQAGETSSSVPRNSLPSQEALPQAPAPAESKENSFDIGVLLEPFSESESEGTSLNAVAGQAGPSHQYQQPSFVANIHLEATSDTLIDTLYASLRGSASAQERNLILTNLMNQIQVDSENLLTETDPTIREIRREVLLERINYVKKWENANQKIDLLKSQENRLFDKLLFEQIRRQGPGI